MDFTLWRRKSWFLYLVDGYCTISRFLFVSTDTVYSLIREASIDAKCNGEHGITARSVRTVTEVSNTCNDMADRT